MSRKEAAGVVTPALGLILGERVGGKRKRITRCSTCLFYACTIHRCLCTCHNPVAPAVKRRSATVSSSASRPAGQKKDVHQDKDSAVAPSEAQEGKEGGEGAVAEEEGGSGTVSSSASRPAGQEKDVHQGKDCAVALSEAQEGKEGEGVVAEEEGGIEEAAAADRVAEEVHTEGDGFETVAIEEGGGIEEAVEDRVAHEGTTTEGDRSEIVAIEEGGVAKEVPEGAGHVGGGSETDATMPVSSDDGDGCDSDGGGAPTQPPTTSSPRVADGGGAFTQPPPTIVIFDSDDEVKTELGCFSKAAVPTLTTKRVEADLEVPYFICQKCLKVIKSSRGLISHAHNLHNMTYGSKALADLVKASKHFKSCAGKLTNL